MTGPSENAFMATLGLSTVATFGALWAANRGTPPEDGPLRVKLGPSITPRSLLVTLVALLGGAGGVGGVAVLLHDVVGDAMLWWVAAFLVPVSLFPTVTLAKWAVAADARGELSLDGDALTLTWDGAETRWHLPECTAILRRAPSTLPGTDTAVLLVVEGPTGTLPMTLPLMGIATAGWASSLQLPEGWFAPPPGAFPVTDVAGGRRLVDDVLTRVIRVDRG